MKHDDCQMADAGRHELSSDLDQVTLTTGDVLEVRAHGVKEVEGFYVFVELMEGSPAYEYELRRVPLSAVADVGRRLMRNSGVAWASVQECP